MLISCMEMKHSMEQSTATAAARQIDVVRIDEVDKLAIYALLLMHIGAALLRASCDTANSINRR